MVGTLNIKVILGSTRQNRFSEIVGKWLMGQLKVRSDIEVELLDLREYPMPFFNEPETPSSKKAPYTEPSVVKWTAKIADADGFILVTPEYNHGYPAVLKNAIDYVSPEWNKKPIGFISYGSAMGVRSVEQLRQVVIELQMVPMRSAIHIAGDTMKAARENADAAFKTLEQRVTGLVDQLVWWGSALKNARTAT